jgi:hypothetical protein
MDVAAQFQASYMRTAGFIVQFEDGLPDDETVTAFLERQTSHDHRKG